MEAEIKEEAAKVLWSKGWTFEEIKKATGISIKRQEQLLNARIMNLKSEYNEIQR